MPEPIYSGDPNKPQIALTFDDEPHPNYTPQLLGTIRHSFWVYSASMRLKLLSFAWANMLTNIRTLPAR